MEIQIEELGMAFVKACFEQFQNGGVFIGLFLAAIAVLGIRRHRQWGMFLACFTILLFLTVFNPLLITGIVSKLHMDAEYYRFLWILPIAVVTAYGLTRLLFVRKKKLLSYMILAVCLALLLFPGKTILGRELALADNLYKVPDELIEVCEVIKKDFEACQEEGIFYPEEQLRVAAEFEWIVLMNQYDPSIELTLTYEGVSQLRALEETEYSELPVSLQCRRRIMYGLLDGMDQEGTALSDAFNVSRTHYIVVREDSQALPLVEKCSYEKIAIVGAYCLYRMIPY